MRNLGWIRSIALFLSSVIAITAAQRNNDFDSGRKPGYITLSYVPCLIVVCFSTHTAPPGVIAGIVISVVIFIVISGIMISIPICVLCCAAHRARGQQMPTTIVASKAHTHTHNHTVTVVILGQRKYLSPGT